MQTAARRSPSGSVRRRRPRERGQALAELAIVSPVAIMLILGVFELGRAQLWQVDVTSAVHAGVLYASQSKTTAADTSGIKARAVAQLGDLPSDAAGSATVNVVLGAPGGDGFGAQQVAVTVSVSVPRTFNIPGLPATYNLTDTATARVLN